MSDLYKVKVYHGTTNKLSESTYLQDTFISLNFSDPSTFGVLVDGSGAPTALYNDYVAAGLMSLAFPYIYANLGNMTNLDNTLNYFQYNLACRIDVSNILSTSDHYLIFTTDNATTYLTCRFKRVSSDSMDVYGLTIYSKATEQRIGNTSVSSASTRYSYSMYVPVWTHLNRLAFQFYTHSSSNYRLRSEQSSNADNIWSTMLANDEPYIEQTDPYAGAGDSTTGGGDGTFDGSSDPVPVPSLPSVGAQDSGFITLFTPTASQMKELAHYMWVNPLFDIETGFKKLFADPMDCILGLSVVPVTIPTSGAKSVNIGNLVTSVTMNVASQQYIEVDCGTVTMDRFFGSYLDYEPYTKIAIFLPYCGTHSLSMDDIAGKTIGVVYHIDILTGSCIAFVKCGDSVLYEFNGACGSNIPVNSLNFASTIENAIRIAVNIGTTVATAGASAPAQTATEVARQKAMNNARNISLAGSTAEGALSLKPNVSRSGALGGGVGILGHQIPYFIITRPRLCKPAKQDFFQGYPSFIQTTIGDLIGKGFTSFTNVIIAGQYLTDEEETELESILESGVYL